MAISTRPISGRAISGDADETAAQQGVFVRNFRAPVGRNRYEDIPMAGPGAEGDAEAASPAPSPLYDALNPEQRAAVDRMIVALRLTNMRGAS
jgi:hypothetical protein